MNAANRGHLEVVSLLLDRGANIEATNNVSQIKLSEVKWSQVKSNQIKSNTHIWEIENGNKGNDYSIIVVKLS